MAAEAGDFAKLTLDLVGNDACGFDCVSFSSVGGARAVKPKLANRHTLEQVFHVILRGGKKERTGKEDECQGFHIQGNWGPS